MDLLAFFSGICVASVGFYVISRVMLKQGPSHPGLLHELNALHAKLSALAITPAPQLPKPAPVLHEKRADVMADTYARLVSLQKHLSEAHVLQTSEGRLYFGGREASERDIEQKLEREKVALVEDYRAFSDFLGTQRIYLDAQLLAGIEPMQGALQKLVAQSVTAGLVRRGDDAPLREAEAQLGAAMRLVETRFKTFAGIE